MSYPNYLRIINRPQRPAYLPLFAVALCLLAGLVTGCRSTDVPPEARFASVEVRGGTPGQLCGTTTEVFQENGYDLMKATNYSLVFEKKASALNNIAYGNWVDTAVWVRVRVLVVPVSEQVWRIQCQACLLRDRGETTEEELKVGKLRAHPYQKLLNAVQKRLGSREVMAGSAQ